MPRSWTIGRTEVVTGLALYGLAVLLALLVALQVPFPPTEVSAYVVAAGRNLAEGRGFVSDVLWSTAAGPLALPRPAFDLWQPLPGFIAAAGMALAGPIFAAGQAAMIAVGAVVAPLTWLVARDAARRDRLSPGRAQSVAVGAGLAAAAFGPFLATLAGPDSAAPFTVGAIASCLLMAPALGGVRGVGLALGVALGLTWLARQEAIWLGLTYLVLAWGAAGSGQRLRGTWQSVRWPILSGALVAVPWVVRNALAFEGGTLRQTIENALLTRNEQIFAYLERPTLAGFLDGGPAAILGRMAEGLRTDLVDTLLLLAIPVGVIGLAALVALRRRPALHEAGPLRALVIAGVLTFLATSLIFPVATRWGTYQHAAGPTFVALIVLALLGLDAAVARLAAIRHWPRENAWLAPAALLAIVLPLSVVVVQGLGVTSTDESARQRAVAAELERLGVGAEPIVTDRPMWLAWTARRSAAELPDEPLGNVLELADRIGARHLLVLDERGRYPAALTTVPACLVELDIDVPDAGIWRIEPGCRP